MQILFPCFFCGSCGSSVHLDPACYFFNCWTCICRIFFKKILIVVERVVSRVIYTGVCVVRWRDNGDSATCLEKNVQLVTNAQAYDANNILMNSCTFGTLAIWSTGKVQGWYFFTILTQLNYQQKSMEKVSHAVVSDYQRWRVRQKVMGLPLTILMEAYMKWQDSIGSPWKLKTQMTQRWQERLLKPQERFPPQQVWPLRLQELLLCFKCPLRLLEWWGCIWIGGKPWFRGCDCQTIFQYWGHRGA